MKLLEAIAILVVALVVMYVWPGDAAAYENTCTIGDIERCAADPCQYVASYRYSWADTDPGIRKTCEHRYNACLDTAARGPCGWAICEPAAVHDPEDRCGSGQCMSFTGRQNVPGIGPTCPAGWVKVR